MMPDARYEAILMSMPLEAGWEYMAEEVRVYLCAYDVGVRPPLGRGSTVAR
jgi:hypothetical protein